MPSKRNPLPNLPGIYKICNIKNGKFYIGSSVNIRKRRTNHLYRLEAGNSSSPILQRAFNKYGRDNFEFSVLEFCDDGVLISREQYWIDLLSPQYNSIKNITVPPMSGRKHSKKSLIKMSKSHSKASQSTKDKISSSVKALWANPFSRNALLKNRKYQNLGKKLNPDKVRELRDSWNNGDQSNEQLQDLFGINRTTLYNVVTFKTWRWVK